jgi:hypothetical protein
MNFLEFMRGIMIGVVVLAILFMFAAVAHAGSAMSKDEILKLPQDKVAVIKAQCAAKWGNDFDMRIYCEDNQYKALRTLIERDK